MDKSSARWWDLPSAVLLFILIMLAALRLEAANWVDGLGHVRNAAILGLIVGMALGRSAFQRRSVILLSAGYMLVVFVWQWMRFIHPPDEISYLGDRLLILTGRLWVSTGDFLGGKPVEDPLLLIALLSVPYWLAGLISGYQAIRRAAMLGVVLPGGILMFFIHVNHITALSYAWLFGLYLFFALLLMNRLKYLTDKRNWTRERVQVPGGSGFSLNIVTSASAALLILLAWGFPGGLPSSARAREDWEEISRELWGGGENEEIFTFITQERASSSPSNAIRTEMALGVQAPQSALIAFVVYAPTAALELPRLYWRGYAYDRYENGRWHSGGLETLSFEPQDGAFDLPRWEQRTNLSFTFDVYERTQNILYVPPQPLWASRTAKVLHAPASEEGGAMDILILQASPPLEAGDIYRVTALLANPTIPELRSAGQDYPEWVAEKYLQLPDDFSPRIRALALEIAAPYDNPYDRALAVTDYLREEIEYASAVSLPQEDSLDPLEYFLFESRQGFCNYYATAEVLMLRSLGIPARLAVGFAQGSADLQGMLYTVRERDSHAWPEVYFPGYGWVEFEPTGNQEALERPLERREREAVPPGGSGSAPPSRLPPEGDEEFTPPSAEQEILISLARTRIFQLGGVALLILLAGVFLLLKRKYFRDVPAAVRLKSAIQRSGWETPAWLDAWSAWASLTSIERYFQSVNIGLRWMGKPQPVHATAAERAGMLEKLLPAAAPSIAVLLHELQSELFRLEAGDPPPARRAAWSILFLTARARLKIFIMGYN
jgi:transglutaminase-like putative cysteine protease